MVFLLQANREEQTSDEREPLAADREVRRSAVLSEWERTCTPPQSEEVCLHFYL